MMGMLNNVAGLAVMSGTHIFSWHQLENEKINFKDWKLYVTFVLNIIAIWISNYFVNKFFKIVCITILLSIINSFLLKKSIKRSILMVVVTQLVIMISEMLLALLFSSLDVDVSAIVRQTFGGFVMDSSVSIMVILIFLFNFVQHVYRFILKKTNKISSNYFIILGFLGIIVSNVLAANVYYKLDFQYLLLFNTFVTVIYFLIIIHALYNKNNYLKVNDKYNTTISSLREYEDILNKYRISNHENKNQLMTIRNMVKNKEKNIVSYIDKVVENKLKDNETLFAKTLVIPEGGLRGLVYSKSLLMKEKEINFEFSIDKAIHTTELIELGDETILDICKIMGVFLDNAIEAVEKLEEKFVDLEMSKEKERLFISVTNNYKGVIDIDHIEEKGFTTKGENHGYGLPLVKELIAKNKLLKNEKMLTNDEFTQRLIIKLAKKK